MEQVMHICNFVSITITIVIDVRYRFSMDNIILIFIK